MKDLKSISLGFFGLVLLCAPALFAQSGAPTSNQPSPPPTHPMGPITTPGLPGTRPSAPPLSWPAAHKNFLEAYTSFIHAAARDAKSDNGFNMQLTALLNATAVLNQSKDSLVAEPGAPYRQIFYNSAVMCQRSAILFWQQTSRMDNTPGRFYLAPTGDITACLTKLAEPDPKF
jgi:hypothetical protein